MKTSVVTAVVSCWGVLSVGGGVGLGVAAFEFVGEPAHVNLGTAGECEQQQSQRQKDAEGAGAWRSLLSHDDGRLRAALVSHGAVRPEALGLAAGAVRADIDLGKTGALEPEAVETLEVDVIFFTARLEKRARRLRRGRFASLPALRGRPRSSRGQCTGRWRRGCPAGSQQIRGTWRRRLWPRCPWPCPRQPAWTAPSARSRDRTAKSLCSPRRSSERHARLIGDEAVADDGLLAERPVPRRLCRRGEWCPCAPAS